jgi:hypothetical protein
LIVGRCCTSVLTSDVQGFLSFEDCLTGQSYARDIKLRNLSEIDAVFTLSYSGPSGVVTIEDYETGESFTRGRLGALASRIVRVMFTPRDVGPFAASITLRNDCDAENVVVIDLIADAVCRKSLIYVSFFSHAS